MFTTAMLFSVNAYWKQHHFLCVQISIPISLMQGCIRNCSTLVKHMIPRCDTTNVLYFSKIISFAVVSVSCIWEWSAIMNSRSTSASETSRLSRSKRKATQRPHVALNTTEILDMKLQYLPPWDMYSAMLVCYRWETVIRNSPEIRRKRFLTT